MSARVTRKRARAAEEEEEVTPLKRELDLDGSVGPRTGSSPRPSAQTEGARQSEAIEEQVIIKDEEFWFEDGTVILIARDIEFRIYEGVLAGLSPVFRHLFSERHTLRSVHMREGQTLSCPVVPVSDSPEDLRHILRACFSKRLGSLYKEREPSYHEMSAVIRLGNKYKLEELYSQSLEYLKRYFPSTLDDWSRLDSYVPPGWNDLEAIGAVNLARATGELSMLPAAFVACICGATSAAAKHGEGIGYGIVPEGENGSPELLSPGDLTICFEGKTRLRMATVAAVLRTFEPTVSRGCNAPSDCRKALSKVLLGLEKHLDLLLGGNPFASYEEFVGMIPGGLCVCSTCTIMVRNQSVKERRHVWDRLPELLGIDVPGWKEDPLSPSPQT